jgi:hypothetical protein
MDNIIAIVINGNSFDLGPVGLAITYKMFVTKCYQFKPVDSDQ